MSNIEKLIEKLKKHPTEVSYKTIKKILNKYGYVLTHSKGSHRRFKKENCPSLTIAVHKNQVKKWYVKDILKILNI